MRVSRTPGLPIRPPTTRSALTNSAQSDCISARPTRRRVKPLSVRVTRANGHVALKPVVRIPPVNATLSMRLTSLAAGCAVSVGIPSPWHPLGRRGLEPHTSALDRPERCASRVAALSEDRYLCRAAREGALERFLQPG